MHRPERAPRPPEIGKDAPAPRPQDVVRMLGWLERGWVHGSTKGPWTLRVKSLMLALLWWPALPLLVPVQFALVYGRGRSTRYYMTPARTAIIAITATRRGWYISDHESARPGTGQGRALRAAVLPKLVSAADRIGLDIATDAATGGLATIYQQDLPGLVDEGRGRLGGRHLCRRANTTGVGE